MKFILLTAVVFTVALVLEGEGGVSHGGPRGNNRKPPHHDLRPCQQRSDRNNYNTFVKRHILRRGFDRNSGHAWARYLDDNKLCGRVPVQSFIEASVGQVEQICSPGCQCVRSNLCISRSRMRVYHVESTNSGSCIVNNVMCRRHNVVVACNNVRNRCLPVHYEKSSPGNVPC